MISSRWRRKRIRAKRAASKIRGVEPTIITIEMTQEEAANWREIATTSIDECVPMPTEEQYRSLAAATRRRHQ